MLVELLRPSIEKQNTTRNYRRAIQPEEIIENNSLYKLVAHLMLL